MFGRVTEQITAEGTWEGLRQFSPRGHAIATGLSAEMAAWMDEGMFARWVLGGLPPYEHLLEKAKQATTPEAFTQVRRVLRSWGLRSRLRPAA